VSADGFLDYIILSFDNGEMKEVSGKIKVRYTENLGLQLFVVLVAAFMGISGSIITAFGLLLYLMQKISTNLNVPKGPEEEFRIKNKSLL